MFIFLLLVGSIFKGASNSPISTSLDDNQTLSDGTDIILFTGVRWILSYKLLFPGLKDVNDVKELARYFSQFHGHFTDYATSFVSEPVHIDSPLGCHGIAFERTMAIFYLR